MKDLGYGGKKKSKEQNITRDPRPFLHPKKGLSRLPRAISTEQVRIRARKTGEPGLQGSCCRVAGKGSRRLGKGGRRPGLRCPAEAPAGWLLSARSLRQQEEVEDRRAAQSGCAPGRLQVGAAAPRGGQCRLRAVI